MKIGIYIRVSTEDQAKEGYSLGFQEEQLATFANRKSLIVLKICYVDGVSDYYFSRFLRVVGGIYTFYK